jgi:hypothetical protein
MQHRSKQSLQLNLCSSISAAQSLQLNRWVSSSGAQSLGLESSSLVFSLRSSLGLAGSLAWTQQVFRPLARGFRSLSSRVNAAAAELKARLEPQRFACAFSDIDNRSDSSAGADWKCTLY